MTWRNLINCGIEKKNIILIIYIGISDHVGRADTASIAMLRSRRQRGQLPGGRRKTSAVAADHLVIGQESRSPAATQSPGPQRLSRHAHGGQPLVLRTHPGVPA